MRSDSTRYDVIDLRQGGEDHSPPLKDPGQAGNDGLAGAESLSNCPGQARNDGLAGAAGPTSLGAGRKGEETQSLPVEEPDSHLWDFLAPAEKPDEIGRLGPYRVLQVLGIGGMGVVFRAEDPHLQRMVALKAMLPSVASSPRAKERFFREARAAAALQHPHIVTIFQVGEDRGAPFLAMEFLEGEPLDDLLLRETRLPIAEILRIGREIAEGLEAAHDKGLIHRDIKPANLWLEGKKGHIKILDFGLARVMGDQTHLTQSGAVVGTPAYMAPEQAGGKQVDGRCDLFSLGCVLYCLCTGERPFKGEDTLSMISALALETPLPPEALNSEVPADLSNLVMQLLAKKLEDRPQSAREVADMLRDIESRPAASGQWPAARKDRHRGLFHHLQDMWVAQASVPVPERESRAPRRWPLPRIVGGGALALAAAALLLFFPVWPSDEPAPEERKAADGTTLTPTPIPAKIETQRKHFTNSIGMKFVWIPPGSFMMGSPREEAARNHDETLHKVTLTRGFFLGVYTVTQEEWQEVMGNNPSKFKGAQNLPVEQVSWHDCQEFINKMREKDTKPYRLPTEAEWEYSCCAGTTTPFFFGETISTDQANYNGDAHGKGKRGVHRGQTVPVGSFLANAFGLHDMAGNVWQWCQDWAGDYPQSDAVDPQGPATGTQRVLRGGSWNHGPGCCRSASRLRDVPDGRSSCTGFRVCFSPVEDNVLDSSESRP